MVCHEEFSRMEYFLFECNTSAYIISSLFFFRSDKQLSTIKTLIQRYFNGTKSVKTVELAPIYIYDHLHPLQVPHPGQRLARSRPAPTSSSVLFTAINAALSLN